jgi:hypothetical protein
MCIALFITLLRFVRLAFIFNILETHSTKDDLTHGKMNGKTVGVAIGFLIVVRVTQGVWEFYWAKN